MINMKKFINKIKAGLVAFRIALITFPLKVNGQYLWGWKEPQAQPDYWIYNPEPVQVLYWVPSSVEPTETIVDTIIKIAPRLLIAITFMVWIVSFIKIRKIEDKEEKNKKIKRTVIVIAILVVILVATFVISALLLWK